MSTPVLTLRDFSVTYHSRDGAVSAVSGVNLEVREREIVGLVGESGCGKTTLSLAIMGLLPSSAQTSGSITFAGRDMASLDEEETRRLRGDRVSMILQDPMTSLDPTFSIGSQVSEVISAHRQVSAKAARGRARDLLSEVGIPDAAARYDDPPHRFSGGMRQRVVIAAALANEPALLLADEPTTALDVTIQAQILELLRDLRHRHDAAIMLITHDLGVVAQVCDRVGVMYAGQLVETAPVSDLFKAPRHPYTRALLAALPTAMHAPGSLHVIDGEVPDLSAAPPGCRFAPRCPHAMAECRAVPPLATDGRGHQVACWLDPVTRAAAGHGDINTIAHGPTPGRSR
jgi:oligopeptide/dipeptide ABC transporter ATP-binding protein